MKSILRNCNSFSSLFVCLLCFFFFQESADTKAEPVRYRNDRRRGVFSEPVTELSDAKPVVIPKSPEQEAAIRQAVSKNFLFNSLDDEQTRIVIDAMFHKTYAAGEVIIRQGDDGDHFYILESGVCSCYTKKVGCVCVCVCVCVVFVAILSMNTCCAYSHLVFDPSIHPSIIARRPSTKTRLHLPR